jgi:hypothetical protein
VQTFVFNTRTQNSGLQYAWDREWDIKNEEEARRAYAGFVKHRDRLDRGVNEDIRLMEEYALRDGFTLVSRIKTNQQNFKDPTNAKPLLPHNPDAKLGSGWDKYGITTIDQARLRYSGFVMRQSAYRHAAEKVTMIERMAEEDGFLLVLPKTRRKKR